MYRLDRVEHAASVFSASPRALYVAVGLVVGDIVGEHVDRERHLELPPVLVSVNVGLEVDARDVG